MTPELVTEYPLIDEILEPHRAGLGTVYPGYRSHAYRMLNYVRFLTPPSPDRDDRVAVMAGFHDLPVLLDWDLEYLDRAADWADEYLDSIGRKEWQDEVRLMIVNHHKFRPYRGPSAPLVEATRKADWIDVSFSKLRFGIPRSYLREVADAFPLDGLYPRPALPKIARYAIGHLRRPLPMMRW